METIIHQALGNIHFTDAAGGLDRADIDDALVRHAALAAGIQHRVVRVEAVAM